MNNASSSFPSLARYHRIVPSPQAATINVPSAEALTPQTILPISLTQSVLPLESSNLRDQDPPRATLSPPETIAALSLLSSLPRVMGMPFNSGVVLSSQLVNLIL